MEEFTFMMIILILPNILGLTIGIYRRKKGKDTISQIFGWIFNMWFVFGFLGAILYEIDREKTSIKEEHYLYIRSLRNMSDIEGEFFLGSGNIESVEYYYFYYESPTGFKRHKIPVNETSIIETDKRIPEIVERKQCYSQNTIVKWKCGEVDKVKEDTYIMYVPKNTIIRKFKVY